MAVKMAVVATIEIPPPEPEKSDRLEGTQIETGGVTENGPATTRGKSYASTSASQRHAGAGGHSWPSIYAVHSCLSGRRVVHQIRRRRARAIQDRAESDAIRD